MEKKEQDYNMFDWWKKVVIKNYANFEGRARRKEYWSFILVYMLLFIPLYILTLLGVAMESQIISIVCGLLLVLTALVMLVPNLAVAVRRMHDVNKSGWILLLGLVPILGVYLLYLNFLEGTVGPNDYGKDPKGNTDSINEIGTAQE